MELPISSHEGVGPIKIGMARQDVRTAVDTGFETFMKVSWTEMPTDAFKSLGIHVHYRKPGYCKAIEMFSPANPTFRGYRLIGVPFAQLRDYFKQKDTSATSVILVSVPLFLESTSTFLTWMNRRSHQ